MSRFGDQKKNNRRRTHYCFLSRTNLVEKQKLYEKCVCQFVGTWELDSQQPSLNYTVRNNSDWRLPGQKKFRESLSRPRREAFFSNEFVTSAAEFYFRVERVACSKLELMTGGVF